MKRIECPACEKSHNSERKAALCRGAKARQLVKRSTVIHASRPLPTFAALRPFSVVAGGTRVVKRMALLHGELVSVEIGGTC